MALGAVATGSINAHEALNTAGTITTSGDSPAAIANAAKTGIRIVEVAVLEVTSVKK